MWPRLSRSGSGSALAALGGDGQSNRVSGVPGRARGATERELARARLTGDPGLATVVRRWRCQDATARSRYCVKGGESAVSQRLVDRPWFAGAGGIAAMAAAVLGLSSGALGESVAVSCGHRVPALTAPSWPAARRELVPRGTVAAQVCRANAHGDVIAATNLGPAAARRLGNVLDAISPENPAESAGCGRASAPDVLVTFGYRTGRVVQVEAEAGGCGVVTNGAVSRSASGRFSYVEGDLTFLSGVSAPLTPSVVQTRGSPPCTTATAAQAPLNGIQTTTLPAAGAPFGIASTADGEWSFVALADGKVEVISDADVEPSEVRVVDVAQGLLAGASVTPNGRYLLVAGDYGAYV